MRKLCLDLDKLVVESFDTDAAGNRGGGTVHGHASRQIGCNYESRLGGCALSDDDPTCAISCGYDWTGCPHGGGCGIGGGFD